MRFVIFLLLLAAFTSCTRTFILTKNDAQYTKAIENINNVGKDRECKITVNGGYTFTTDSLFIVNDSVFYKKAAIDSLSSIPLSKVTSIYYTDHSDGFGSGSLLGMAIGFPVGYLTIQDWTDVGGATHHSPLTGGCCLGALGFSMGGTFGAIRGAKRIYELTPDSLQSDSLYLSQ